MVMFSFNFLNDLTKSIQETIAKKSRETSIRSRVNNRFVNIDFTNTELNQLIDKETEEGKKRLLGFVRSAPFLVSAGLSSLQTSGMQVNDFFARGRESFGEFAKQQRDFILNQTQRKREFRFEKLQERII